MHARNKAAISAATGNSEPLCLLCNKTHKAALFKDTSRTQWVPQPINPLLPHRPPHAASLSHWHQLLKVIRKHAVRNHFPPESFSHRFSEHILKRKKKPSRLCLFSFMAFIRPLSFLLRRTMDSDFCLSLDLFTSPLLVRLSGPINTQT